jgi:hypothetical protein
MPTLYQNEARKLLSQRLARLRPDAPPRWGRFTAPQMLAHVNDGLRMALGDLPTAPKDLPLRYPPLKQLLVYVLPFPKGAPTSRELLARVANAQWDAEVAAFPGLLERAGACAGRRDWPLHPAFGRLSSRAWGVLGYRHVDHHFTQFSV